MAGKRQPINLLLIKGNKHLTKQEIEDRQKQEVKAAADKIRAPAYLPKDLKREFKKIADELMKLDIMSNLDVDALARFLFAKKEYLKITIELSARSPVGETHEDEEFEDGMVVRRITEVPSETYGELLQMQDKAFKQCRQSASDMGLTIASRCRLVVPKVEDKPKGKFDKRFGDV